MTMTDPVSRDGAALLCRVTNFVLEITIKCEYANHILVHEIDQEGVACRPLE